MAKTKSTLKKNINAMRVQAIEIIAYGITLIQTLKIN